MFVPKLFYISFIWDQIGETTMYKCLRDMLGVQFNAPKEALHQLSGIPAVEMHHFRSIYTYWLLAAANGSLMEIFEQSKK